MTQDHAALYRALTARDSRFDGVFFVGVTSTGIYCRPVCTARTPKAENCRFFPSAEGAEKANFRPCLRCRPELAPGTAPIDDGRRIATLLAHRIEEGMLDDGVGLEQAAARLGWSSRQIRRIVQKELGVAPMELVLTRRLLLAKQLLTETTLPVTEIAFASGFGSLRRFNDAFSGRYGMPPSRLRKVTDALASRRESESLTLQLSYRPPFDWDGMLAFLAARAGAGVEAVDGDRYLRTVRLGSATGWVSVRPRSERHTLLVTLGPSLTAALPPLLGRLRHLFDLSARPDLIDAHLSEDPLLGESVAANPGLRVPGAFDGFELAVRAVLGQQITVKAATDLAGRFAARFGEPIATGHPSLTHLTPTASRVAAASEDEIAGLGIIRQRARAIIAVAREMATGNLRLEPGADPDEVIARLTALPGIGDWTARYLAMRALRWPDAFLAGDVVVRNRLGLGAEAAEERSRAWSPWRSYAVLHLWRSSPVGRNSRTAT